jgi:hypothetical protein
MVSAKKVKLKITDGEIFARFLLCLPNAKIIEKTFHLTVFSRQQNHSLN